MCANICANLIIQSVFARYFAHNVCSTAFTSAACLASHSLYLATVSTAQIIITFPVPSSILFKIGHGCNKLAGITGFNKTVDF